MVQRVLVKKAQHSLVYKLEPSRKICFTTQQHLQTKPVYIHSKQKYWQQTFCYFISHKKKRNLQCEFRSHVNLNLCGFNPLAKSGYISRKCSCMWHLHNWLLLKGWIVSSWKWNTMKDNIIVFYTACKNVMALLSLVPRPSQWEGKEGLVHTVCACA